MKVKTVIIAVAVTAAAAGGVVYGVRYSMQSQKKPVNVVPVANVNYSVWNNDTMSGNIISKDTQTVQLNSEYDLVKVYVQTGDTVKIGDPLLEYDMTLIDLKKEMEDLTRQTLELNLTSQQKALKKLQNTAPSASLEISGGTLTASGDGLVEDVGDTGNVSPLPEDTAGEDLTDQTEAGGDDLISDEPGEDGGSSQDPVSDGDNSMDDLIQDPTTDDVQDSEQIVAQVNAFLNRVLQISDEANQGYDKLLGTDISEALRIYREILSDSQEIPMENLDALGEKRTKKVYSLKAEVASVVGESTAAVLEEDYRVVCCYQFIYAMLQLNPQRQPIDEIPDETVKELETKIRTAVDAYYDLDAAVWENDSYKEILTPYRDELAAFAARLNHQDTIEETEITTEEPDTENPGDDDWGGGDDFGGGDDGSGYTADELKEAIADQKREIAETQLQIRESEIKLKQYQRTLDNKIVTSTMDGVVKSAGTVDESVSDEDFIVVTGASGMYVQGTISETKLDTVKVGDQVSGMSYDTGMSFTATITEISQYPTSGDNVYYGDGITASSYPFLAYIEDADGLSEGYVDLQIVDNTPSTGIYLEKYFILKENNGRSYVYKQGGDGLLTKQYVTTGATFYDTAIEIKEGLSKDDKIAFPYGKDVVEGAQTKEVDNLYDSYSGYGIG